jgi:hypothetical protein
MISAGCLAAFLFFWLPPARADHTKTMSGKIRKVDGNVLLVDKPGLVSITTIEFELNDATKKSGQVVPGMHVKLKYREEGRRKIVIEMETRPEFASKTAKKAAKQTESPP